jgi:hypothetical protein
MMEDTEMASQSPPPPPAEVKGEEQLAESKEPEVLDGNATTPAPEAENATTPTPALATGITKQVVEVIEGILHRLTAYKTDEYVFTIPNKHYSS